MLKAVFDTNVLVSVLVHGGKSRQLIDAVTEGKILLYISVEMVEELRKVPAREKFKLTTNQQNLPVNFIVRTELSVEIKIMK
jgi:putative PIN family toxin of toxin-antitoxin system